MGLEKDAKYWVWDNFRECILDKCPTNIQIVSIDLMQYLKQPLPETVKTKQDLVKYFVSRATFFFRSRIGVKVVIVNVDRESPSVKKLIEHPRRHNTRCNLCQVKIKPDCEKRCLDKEGLRFKDGPHLPAHMHQELPEFMRENNWIRFARDSRNLRAELYPLLVNEFLNTVPPEPDQRIICNGFPVRTLTLYDDEFKDETGYAPQPGDNRVRIIQWLETELPITLDDKYFEEVFMVYRVPPTPERPQGWMLKTGCPEMKNTIREADNSVFFFSQFFPQWNQIIDINDGDAIPIGLLRVAEDYRGDPEPTHVTYIRVPFKTTDKKKIQQWYGDRTPPRHEYLNVTQLYSQIYEYPIMKNNGVQNPVVTVVGLLIMGGTDFFKDFCPGIGFRKVILQTFLDDIQTYSHMFQWYINDLKRDPKAQRRVVYDEELFVKFVYACYFNKWMKNKNNATLEELEIRCSKLKIKKYHLPTRDQILVWVRNHKWNKNYWLNACRDIEIDAFEEIDGLSYYGYSHKTKGITASVYPHQKPVDKVFIRNFYENKVVAAVEPKKKKVKV